MRRTSGTTWMIVVSSLCRSLSFKSIFSHNQIGISDVMNTQAILVLQSIIAFNITIYESYKGCELQVILLYVWSSHSSLFSSS